MPDSLRHYLGEHRATAISHSCSDYLCQSAVLVGCAMGGSHRRHRNGIQQCRGISSCGDSFLDIDSMLSKTEAVPYVVVVGGLLRSLFRFAVGRQNTRSAGNGSGFDRGP